MKILYTEGRNKVANYCPQGRCGKNTTLWLLYRNAQTYIINKKAFLPSVSIICTNMIDAWDNEMPPFLCIQKAKYKKLSKGIHTLK